MTRTFLVRNKQPQHSLPGRADKQTSKPKIKKYGANAPQLHAIRCSIDFCVMLCNEQAKKQKNTAQMRHSCTLFSQGSSS